MLFEGRPIPGGCFVEIISITNKDGSPLEPDNWRKKRFGQISLCWIAGGFRQRGAYFKGMIRMENGEPVIVNLDFYNWCSTTTAQPVEVEPDVFELETNTSIYRIRLLSEEEAEKVMAAVQEMAKKEMELRYSLMAKLTEPSAGGFPTS